MDINDGLDSPMLRKVSFHKLLAKYEGLLESDDQTHVLKAKHLLSIADAHPELRDGFSDLDILERSRGVISKLLEDLFPPLLTDNEIKTASIPLHNVAFNSTERFKKIIGNAGENFELQIKNISANDRYRYICNIILMFCYGFKIDFKRPVYYEIPDENGTMHYYKVLYNADFCDVQPTENAPKIGLEDYRELLDNYDDFELWKEKFPPNSYLFKGFVIANIFDVTNDQAISNLKSNLIGKHNSRGGNSMKDFEDVFRSLFRINNLQVGFSNYNNGQNKFEIMQGLGTKSFLLGHKLEKSCRKTLCDWSYNRLLNEKECLTISNVSKALERSNGNAPHLNTLHEQKIESVIFAPISNGDGLMGVLEIVSDEAEVLNSINANKLEDVMPFLVSSVERSKKEEQHLIEAVIQQECTSIHPSVQWKFVEAAQKFLRDKQKMGSNASFKKIVFNNIYPLFGQIDVKGSSEARNLATQKDLLLQLSLLEKIMHKIIELENLPIYEQIVFQIKSYHKDLKTNYRVDSEHSIAAFLKKEVEPLLRFHKKKYKSLKEDIDDYFGKIDPDVNLIYYYRKNYDHTISRINKNMASLLDEKQIQAQAMYPHYFERYKTDGVEHNMYIGESLTKQNNFNDIYLFNLRLWQLQVMCEMENDYYNNQHLYPINMDVASMILVFNQPLSIRFRMDEKQFDVDGTYNARYEVVKKRVDKALIKGTDERITQTGKITIVYSQKEDEQEYLKYIEFLQSKNILNETVEIFELEDLQGVTGLKAIRADILYNNKQENNHYYTYQDLMKEIKS